MILIMDEAMVEAVVAVVVVAVVVVAVVVATTHRMPRCLLLPTKINMLQYHQILGILSPMNRKMLSMFCVKIPINQVMRLGLLIVSILTM